MGFFVEAGVNVIHQEGERLSPQIKQFNIKRIDVNE
jgi:hypothetical protein